MTEPTVSQTASAKIFLTLREELLGPDGHSGRIIKCLEVYSPLMRFQAEFLHFSPHNLVILIPFPNPYFFLLMCYTHCQNFLYCKQKIYHLYFWLPVYMHDVGFQEQKIFSNLMISFWDNPIDKLGQGLKHFFSKIY